MGRRKQNLTNRPHLTLSHKLRGWKRRRNSFLWISFFTFNDSKLQIGPLLKIVCPNFHFWNIGRRPSKSCRRSEEVRNRIVSFESIIFVGSIGPDRSHWIELLVVIKSNHGANVNNHPCCLHNLSLHVAKNKDRASHEWPWSVLIKRSTTSPQSDHRYTFWIERRVGFKGRNEVSWQGTCQLNPVSMSKEMSREK